MRPVILITGGSRGIGAACAEQAAEAVGVVDAVIRGIGAGHGDAEHAVRAECFDGEMRCDGGVDSTGETDHRFGKSHPGDLAVDEPGQ